MDMELTITLLTIAVILLSVVIIALLVAVIVVLIKVRQLTKTVNNVLNNVSVATEWLSPVKLFREAQRIFRKN